MKKIVKLTESELKKVLKKIINESLLLESSARSLNRSQLEQTYTKYLNMGKGDDGPRPIWKELFPKEMAQVEAGKGVEPWTEVYNTCATKVSLALKAAGVSVKPSFVVQGGPFKGTGIVTSANGLKNELLKKWGKPDVKIDKVTSLDEIQQKIGPGRSGVLICAPCGFNNATGHATIWSWWKNNGKGGPLDDENYPQDNGGTIYFWGAGGTNNEVATKCGYTSWEEFEKSKFKCKTN